MKNGFTLTEILVYVAVLAVIMTAVAVLFFGVISAANKAQVTQETLESVRFAMEAMSYEIRMADGVYDPTSVFDSNPGQLSLETSSFLPSGESSSYVDFYLCAGRLCVKRESQDPVALTSDRVVINNLVFKKIITGGMVSVAIDLGAHYANYGNKPEFQIAVNASSTIALRKY